MAEVDAIRDNLAGDYCLTRDIDVGGLGNFVPIGSPDAPFAGTLDGQGHNLRGLTIDAASNGSSFFGSLSGGAVVRNLGLLDARVLGRGYRAAILADYSDGLVSRVWVTGSVECLHRECEASGLIAWNGVYGRIEYARSRATVTCQQDLCRAAGFAVRNHGAIAQSSAAGPVQCSAIAQDEICWASGFVDENRVLSSIQDVYASGDVGCIGSRGCGAAGLIFTNERPLERCAALGAVSASGPGSIASGAVALSSRGTGSLPASYCMVAGNVHCAAGDVSPIGETCDAAGFVNRLYDGYSGAEISQAYSIGRPTCEGNGCRASGFGNVHQPEPPGQVARSYWDTRSSGTRSSDVGAGRRLKRGLPPGLSVSRWSTVPGLTYPWLDPRKLPAEQQATFELDLWAPPLAYAGRRRLTHYFFQPVGQFDAFNYRGGAVNPQGAAKAAALATVARAAGALSGHAALPRAPVSDYWNGSSAVWSGPAVVRTHFRSPALGIDEVAPDDTNLSPIGFGGDDVIQRLLGGSFVLLKGTTSAGGPGTHWMVGTSVVVNDAGAVDGVAALDPWTGRQVILRTSDWRVAFPPNYAARNFTFTATQYLYFDY